MSYTPTTFSPGTVLTAADLQANTDDLRIYLHEGIQAGDINPSQWVETRHIQPPRIDPIRELQHGVSGWQGGQTTSGPNARLSFMSSFFSGGGKEGVLPDHWAIVPQASFTLDLRRPAKVLLHWTAELANGPDNLSSTSGYNYAEDDRYVYLAPYIGNTSTPQIVRSQETRNALGFKAAAPYGVVRPYALAGWGNREGVYLYPPAEGDYASVGSVTVGLAYYSRSDRAVLARWSIAIEAWYI